MYLTDSELILNADGSIYHLNLLPEDIADTIILVGDPNRVKQVSKYFDHIEVQKQNVNLSRIQAPLAHSAFPLLVQALAPVILILR